MAKASLPDDPGRSAATPGGSDPDRAVVDDGLLQKVSERRAAAERLLEAEQFEAAAPMLVRLAKLPHEATRETAAWARRQLQQLRAASGRDPRAAAARRNETAANQTDAGRATDDDSDGASNDSADDAASPPLADKLRSLVSAGPALPIIASVLGLVVGYFAVSAAMRPPSATVRIAVDAEARGQGLGLGFAGRLHEVDILSGELRGPPGRQTLAITQGRVERAALDLELANGEQRAVRLVWKDGAPELEVPGADGSILARSIVARQPVLPPEPTPLKKPAPPTSTPPATIASTPSKTPAAVSGATPGGIAPPATSVDTPQPPALSWQQERELLIKLIGFREAGLALSAFVTVGGGSQFVGIARVEQIPREPALAYHINLTRTGAADEVLTLLRDLPRLQSVTLIGVDWSPRDLEPLRGNSAIQSFVLLPAGPTFANLSPFPAGRALADMRTLQAVTIECATLADDDLEQLKELKRLSRCQLAADALTPRGMAHMGEFPALRMLRLRWMDVERGGATDAHLQALRHSSLLTLELENGPRLTGEAFSEGQFPALNGLNLNDCPAVDDAALGRIVKSFPLLMTFSLNRRGGGPRDRATASAVTDKGLGELKALANLRSLTIQSAEGVTDEGMPRIAECPQLYYLDLSGCSITDNGAAALTPLKLSYLGLARTRVGDRACAELARMQNLGTILLDNTEVTDEGVLLLKPLKTLRFLSVRQTAVTAGAVKELRDSIPMLNVNIGP